MAHLAYSEVSGILDRLKIAFEASGKSLRSVAAESAKLDSPESVHHSNLSFILRRKEGRDLYLQTFLALCGIIGVDPISVMLDDQAALVARGMEKLPASGRIAVLSSVLRELERSGASEALQQRLRRSL